MNPTHHPTDGTATATPDEYIGDIRSASNSVSFLTGY